MSVHKMTNAHLTTTTSTPIPQTLIPRTSMDPITVTPDIARDWLATYTFDRQRLLRPEAVEFYANEIRSGRWYPSVLDFRFVTATGQLVMVNGYHRLEAIIAANTPVPMFVVRIPVADEEELAAHYSTFDQHRRRNLRDTIRAYNLTSETQLTFGQQERISATAAHIESGFMVGVTLAKRARGMAQQQKVQYIRHWLNPAVLAFASIGESNTWRVRRMYVANVFCVILVTFKHDPEQAEIFWRNVATQENLPAYHPALKLGDILSTYKAAYNSRDNKLPRMVATAWNAFKEDRPLQRINVFDPNAPIRILGTPYTGTAHVRPDATIIVEEA